MMKFLKTVSVLAIVFAAGACTQTVSESMSSSSRFWSGPAKVNPAHAAIDDAISSELSALLEKEEWESAVQAQSNALNGFDEGASVNWRNRDSGATGKVDSGPLYYVNDKPCRDYKHSIEVEGNTKNFSGSACKENGEWQLLG